MDPQTQTYTLGFQGVTVTVERSVWLPGPSNPSLEGARMRVTVVDSDGNIPKELFVWEEHRLFNETDAKAKDRLLCVAKVSDLSAYPVGAPDTYSGLPPFYREAFMDVVMSSPEDVAMTWDDVQRDISALVQSLVQLSLYSGT